MGEVHSDSIANVSKLQVVSVGLQCCCVGCIVSVRFIVSGTYAMHRVTEASGPFP